MSDATTSAASILSLDREKPHNNDAEIAVLGAMLISADAAGVGLAQLNFPDAFYLQAHQTIFNAMQALNPQGKAGLDPVVLSEYLQKNNQLDIVGGASYLAMLMDKVPTASHIDHYVKIVKQNAILRRIISTCAESILKCYESDGGAEELLDNIESTVLEISQMNQHQDYKDVGSLVMEAMTYITQIINPANNGIMGIPTGFEDLDKAITGGLKPGTLFVLAARPSIGKTALALNIASNIALGGTPVGIFSLEMSSSELTLRLISSIAKVNISGLAYQGGSISAADMQSIKEAASMLRKSKIYIDETGGIDILELRSKARRMVEKHGIKVLFIDYLQLVTISSLNRSASRENEVAKISGALKALAKELKIPVVVLAQVNRAAEQGNGVPKLSNLRESGAIEQDADVVTFLHRDREMQYQDGNKNEPLEAKLVIAKNRNGRLGTQELLFYPYYTLFEGTRETVSAEDVPQKK